MTEASLSPDTRTPTKGTASDVSLGPSRRNPHLKASFMIGGPSIHIDPKLGLDHLPSCFFELHQVVDRRGPAASYPQGLGFADSLQLPMRWPHIALQAQRFIA